MGYFVPLFFLKNGFDNLILDFDYFWRESVGLDQFNLAPAASFNSLHGHKFSAGLCIFVCFFSLNSLMHFTNLQIKLCIGIEYFYHLKMH